MSYHVLHRSDRSYEVRMTCGRVCGGGALRWAENSGRRRSYTRGCAL